MSDSFDQAQDASDLHRQLECVYIPRPAIHILNGVRFSSSVTEEWSCGFPGAVIRVSFEGLILVTSDALLRGERLGEALRCSRRSMNRQVKSAVKQASEKLRDVVKAYHEQHDQ